MGICVGWEEYVSMAKCILPSGDAQSKPSPLSGGPLTWCEAKFNVFFAWNIMGTLPLRLQPQQPLTKLLQDTQRTGSQSANDSS